MLLDTFMITKNWFSLASDKTTEVLVAINHIKMWHHLCKYYKSYSQYH